MNAIPSHTEVVRRLNLTALVFAFLTVAIATLILSGWVFDIGYLTKVLRSSEPMGANSALCFILAGLTVWLRQGSPFYYQKFKNLFPIFIVAIAGLTIIEYLMPVQFSIDKILTPGLPIARSVPDRMSPVTAFNFILLGLSLLSLKPKEVYGGYFTIESLAIVSWLVAFFSLIGFSYKADLTFRGIPFEWIPLDSSILFFISSLGVLMTHPGEGIMRYVVSDSPAGVVARRLIPAAIILPSFSGWLRLQGQASGLFRLELVVALYVLLTVVLFVGLIWWSASIIFKADAARRAAEAETRGNEERLVQVLEAAPNGLLMADRSGRIVLCNGVLEKLFGYSHGELRGKKLEILLTENLKKIHDKNIEDYFKQPESRLMGSGKELNGKRKDGVVIPIEIGLNPVQTKDGPFVLASVIDITERKKVAQALSNAKEAAESANYAKSSFLANMSHEIRTPLGAILGFSELITDPQVKPSEKANFAAAMRRNGELLSNIINDILDLSKIEIGKMQIVAEEVALKEILADTKTMLELQSTEKGVALSIAIDDTVPEIIKTDALRLRQILINIIGNAIKFTHRGSVDVRVKYDASEGAHGRLEFIVKDTGRGIEAEQVGKLFAPFAQEDATSKRNFGGTGLGLILSKRFANLLGGDVVLLQSEVGKGSTFKISIDPGPIRTVVADDPKNPRLTTIPSAKKPLSGIKILLAEDSPDNQIVVSHFLKLAGAAVEIAANGKIAFEKAFADRYNLILMDLQMPVMDGYEATQELRNKGYSGNIVALTAHTLDDDRERCLRSGFDGHLGKPVNRNVLIEQVEALSKLERTH